MRIGEREISAGVVRPYVIAEIGVNHDGDVERALMLTDAAAEAGADAVKLQLFETDRLMSRAAKLAAYQKSAGETDPLAMLRRLELSIDDMARVVERAHERGIHAIVTVFSVELVEVAERLAWDAYKSASPDIINRPLLEAMAETGKSLIVSTGASNGEEVSSAHDWLASQTEQLAFLHCVSSYPTDPDDAHLRMMRDIGRRVGACVVGYSDHTASVSTGAMAAGEGAAILEKHLTYDRGAKGPDHAASLEPSGFREYVRQLSAGAVERDDRMLGDSTKRVLDCEQDVRHVSRQSLTTTRDLSEGYTLTRDDLTIKRPGTGIEPYRLDEVIGATLRRDVEADVPLADEDVGGRAR